MIPMRPEDLLRAASSGVEAVRVKGSALNPLLWLVGIVTPLSLVLTFLAAEPSKAAFFLGIAVFPIILLASSYLTLLWRDPDRLQTEEYRLVQRALKMLYRRGANTEIVEVAKDIVKTQKYLEARNDGGSE